MKIWRFLPKLKASPNLYRKGKFDQMLPSLKLTRQQKKKFQPSEKFFARELKKSILLSIKIKALKSYFYAIKNCSFTHVVKTNAPLFLNHSKTINGVLAPKNFSVSNRNNLQKQFDNQIHGFIPETTTLLQTNQTKNIFIKTSSFISTTPLSEIPTKDFIFKLP